MAKTKFSPAGVLAVWLLALFIFAFLPAVAKAQTITAEPGKSETLVDWTIDSITEEKAIHGQVNVIKNADGVRQTLVYLSHPELSNFNDTVTYKLGGEERTLTVFVAGGAKTFGSEEVYEKAFQTLFILFMLAVVVESGLQLVFRWRPYLRSFNTAGVNALVAFTFSFILVRFFQLDITTQLVNAYTKPEQAFGNSFIGYVLTAMIIAGGSAGVNRVFRAFGFRPIGPPAEIAGPRDNTIAWISVALERDNAIGTVDVLFGDSGKPAVIGSISGNRPQSWLSRLFFRDFGRFPQSGGFTVAVKDDQVIKLVGRNANGDPIEATWGPFHVGPRAIIDVELAL